MKLNCAAHRFASLFMLRSMQLELVIAAPAKKWLRRQRGVGASPMCLSAATLTTFAAALACMGAVPHGSETGSKSAPQRRVLICVSDGASPAIRKAAEDMAQNPTRVPALKALTETQGAGPVQLQSSEGLLKNYELAAFNHLIVIGLPSSDPLLAKVWEHYAALDESKKTLYAQGWGYLAGDIGYIESDRNPFLHSRRIAAAPFETVLMKISGTSEAGLFAALKSFDRGLLNGIVPAGPLHRPKTTVLDLDPFPDPCPLTLPATISVSGPHGPLVAPLAGWTQVPADEYRAIAEVGAIEPLHVWRYKYLPPGALAKAGISGWLSGFHRIAWGNAVTIAEFSSPQDAMKTAQAVGATSGFRPSSPGGKHAIWLADQPAAPNDDEELPSPPGKIVCAATGRFVVLSSLDSASSSDLLQALTAESTRR